MLQKKKLAQKEAFKLTIRALATFDVRLLLRKLPTSQTITNQVLSLHSS